MMFTYYGGKVRLSKRITSLIAPHVRYVEPYAGMASVFFAKPLAATSVLNDSDRRLVRFFRVLQTRFDELHALCRGTAYAVSEARDAYHALTSNDDVRVAWGVFVLTQMTYGHRIQECLSDVVLRREKHVLRKRPQTWRTKIGLLEVAREKLQDATIECSDALSVMRKYDTPETFMFVDPPYLGSDTGHYSISAEQNSELLEFLRTAQAKYILTTSREAIAGHEGIFVEIVDNERASCYAPGGAKICREVICANYAFTRPEQKCKSSYQFNLSL